MAEPGFLMGEKQIRHEPRLTNGSREIFLTEYTEGRFFHAFVSTFALGAVASGNCSGCYRVHQQHEPADSQRAARYEGPIRASSCG